MSRTHRLAALVCGRRSKWIVLAFWVAVLAVTFPLSAKLMDAQENDAAAWLPGSAESTKVFEAQQATFQTGENLPAVVVYERTSGITEADLAAAADHAEQIAELDNITGEVIGPVPSEDGQAMQVIAQVDVGTEGWFVLTDVVDDITRVTGTDNDGMSVHVTGPAGINADFAGAFEGIDSTLLYAAMTVVIVILLLSYRSPLLWALPVVSAFTALTVAQAVVYLLAEYADLTVNAQTAGILLVLVFGASTDYALLIVARYREELRRHEDRHEAMAFALHRAGPAIVASASTVVVGMLCLLAADMNSTRGMGPVLAIGIVIGLVAINTGVIANRDAFSDTPASVVGEGVIARHFAAGTGNPLVVIGNTEAADEIRTALDDTEGISEVSEPAVQDDVVYLEGTLEAAAGSTEAQATVDRARDAVHAVPDGDALVGGNTAIALD